jgi:hypothetical protein
MSDPTVEQNIVEEVGKPVEIKEIEKEVLKGLRPRSTWIKTKEVLKTAGKVTLMVVAAAAIVAALGAGSAYAEKHMK